MNANTIQITPDFRTDQSGRAGWRAWARQRLAGWRRYQQRRLAIRELSRMSDWRLQDMGILRGQIPEIVDGLIALNGPDARSPAR